MRTSQPWILAGAILLMLPLVFMTCPPETSPGEM
jgi:hypothetical protein